MKATTLHGRLTADWRVQVGIIYSLFYATWPPEFQDNTTTAIAN